ncbi:MAG: diacylglycerol kinase family protein [Vicinamibacterales bacterium]
MPARIAVVRNPKSGSALDSSTLEQALRAAGISADILDMPGEDEFDRWIDRVTADHDVIAAAGGDGTVSAVAAGVARSGKTLAVIPTGTLNHFARDAGISTELNEAIALLRTASARGVDIGYVNDRFFLNNVSIGSYPRMVHARTELEDGGMSRRLAGMIAVAQTWWRLRSVTAAITIDGREVVRRSPFIVIGNGSYVLSGFALGQRDDLSGNQLSLYVAPRAGRLGSMSLPFRALLGRLERYEQFETMSGKEITITLGHRKVFAGIDGEVAELDSPLRFTIHQNALQVVRP